MADTENDDIVTLNVKYHAIIANTETITTEGGISQWLGILERIIDETQEGISDTFFNIGFKSVNVLDSFLSVRQMVTQCPKTSSCLFVRPAI
jgi:hypothetical protein